MPALRNISIQSGVSLIMQHSLHILLILFDFVIHVIHHELWQNRRAHGGKIKKQAHHIS